MHPAPPILLPGSKSIAARALIASFVAGRQTELRNLPDCDDTRELSSALRQLTTLLNAQGAKPDRETPIERFDLGTGATSLRFFTALAAAMPGFRGVVDCSDSLRRRPLAALLDSLRSLGAQIACLEADGCAPLLIRGRRLSGGTVRVSTAISSQFLSALLLVAPLMAEPLTPVSAEGTAVSEPYVAMTRAIADTFYPNPPAYYDIEPDWSAAAFFYEWCMLQPLGTRLRIPGLIGPLRSLQGDAHSAELFSRLGVASRFDSDGATIERSGQFPSRLDTDLRSMPDLAPALAVGCCVAGIPFRLSGVGHLRHKESDRLEALVAELDKVGFLLRIGEDSLLWYGERCARSTDPFDSHADHRIAMALAAAFPNREITGKDCVTKSFPNFFKALSAL